MQKEISWLLEEKYLGKPNKNFEKDVKRLEVGEPVDYVIGFTEFLGCKIDLSKKPLIPRPETEFWVGESMKSIKHRRMKVLDIFSGSGCIGLAVLKNINNSRVDFAEKDKKSLEQIRINCRINNIDKKRYKIIRSDIFRGLYPSASLRTKYDFVFANPPYIPTKRKNKIQKSVLKYEPKMALFSGRNGLFHIKKLLSQAKDYLNPDGKIFMEFGSEQKKEIEKIIQKYKYSSFKFYRDQFGRWRWVSIA